MSGLSLVAGRTTSIDTPYIVTEAKGRSRGRVWPLELHSFGARSDVRRGAECEPADEQAAPDGQGRLLRYELAAIPDGVFEAEAGPDGELAYFEVTGGSVGREFDQRHAHAEVKRRR